jgi:hypothetical protein
MAERSQDERGRRRPEDIEVVADDRATGVERPEPTTGRAVAVGGDEDPAAERDDARVDGDGVPERQTERQPCLELWWVKRSQIAAADAV